MRCSRTPDRARIRSGRPGPGPGRCEPSGCRQRSAARPPGTPGPAARRQSRCRAPAGGPPAAPPPPPSHDRAAWNRCGSAAAAARPAVPRRRSGRRRPAYCARPRPAQPGCAYWSARSRPGPRRTRPGRRPPPRRSRPGRRAPPATRSGHHRARPATAHPRHASRGSTPGGHHHPGSLGVVRRTPPTQLAGDPAATRPLSSSSATVIEHLRPRYPAPHGRADGHAGAW